MAERKKTPNILADLLGDKSQEPLATAQETQKQQDVLPVKQQNLEIDAKPDPATSPERSGADEEPVTGKLKVTFYLSEASFDLLEDAQRKLRRMSRGTGKTQSKAATSKSALLEEALKIACADLEKQGQESQLARIVF